MHRRYQWTSACSSAGWVSAARPPLGRRARRAAAVAVTQPGGQGERAGDRGGDEDRRGDGERRREAGAQRGRRSLARTAGGVAGGDRAENGEAERAADLAGGVEQAAGQAALIGRHARGRGHCDRREHQPAAGHRHARGRDDPGDVGARRQPPQPRRTGRSGQAAGGEQQPSVDA